MDQATSGKKHVHVFFGIDWMIILQVLAHFKYMQQPITPESININGCFWFP